MSTAVTRYADVLYELARERDGLQDISSNLETLQALLDESDIFRTIWLHPVLDAELKKKMLEPALTPYLSSLAWDFLRLLMDRSREALLLELGPVFEDRIRKARGITRAEVFSPKTLPEGFDERLSQALTDLGFGQIVVEERLDPALLGGIMVRIGDRKIDGTLRRRLQEMEGLLTGGDV